MKYYYNEKDNKAVKISPENIMVYYQVKHYTGTGEIRHSYGKTVAPSAERALVELKDFVECDSKRYEEVVRSYYAREKENMDKVRNYFKGKN